MSITDEKSTIINFFEKKNEALNWVKSISQWLINSKKKRHKKEQKWVLENY
jgi:hypothetical protein